MRLVPVEAEARRAVLVTRRSRDLRARVEAGLLARHRADPARRRLARSPGVGPPTAGTVIATVPAPPVFRPGRGLAAWPGPAPRQPPAGGKERPGRISRHGNRPVRRPLIVGAHSALPRSGEVRANARVQGPP